MSNAKRTSCVQCDLPCREDAVAIDGQHFCCSGCATIYRIINEGDTNPAYLEDIQLSRAGSSDTYSFLDDEEMQLQLLSYRDDNHALINLSIPRIHCSSCVWLLENVYRMETGIISSNVQLMRRKVSIRYNPKATSLRRIIELLSSLGYAPELTPVDQKQRTPAQNRTLLLQLGVAGFCFGNMMLLSFPEYLSGTENVSANFRNFFGYVSIFLSLPVLFFSAKDFFRRAVNGLRHRRITIDVPLSLGMIAFYIRSLYDILTASGMGFMDSFAGLVFLLLIGRWLQERTYGALAFERDYQSFFPISVTRIEQDGSKTIPLFRLKPGDRILVRQNELIPADAVLMAGDAKIDFSFVTGESAPQRYEVGAHVYAGGRQTGTTIELQITREVSQSYLTQLWNEQPFRQPKHPLSNFADRVSGIFTIAILLIAIVSALYWLPIDVVIALNAFSSVLIIACPCALALSSPFALGQAQRLLGQYRLFLKNPGVVETLAGISHIVFDKTGTLTHSKETKAEYQRICGETAEEAISLAVAAAKLSAHPLSRSIAALGSSSIREAMSFEEIAGNGIKARVEKRTIRIGSAEFTGAKTSNSETVSYLKIDNQIVGYFTFRQAYRTGMRGMFNLLLPSYSLSLLSGDNAAEETNLRNIMGGAAALHFMQSPKDKLNYIGRLQENESVLMLGDGLNDAGALKQSSCGIAVAEDVHSFVPACDAIMNADELQSLPKFLKLAKHTLTIIKMNLGISLAYNLVGLSFAIQGTLSPLICAVLMPLSSISVIFLASSGVHLSAKYLGFDSEKMQAQASSISEPAKSYLPTGAAA
ncbi:MAG: heavy metal translocating P-type ATPase [Calditrichia bacterium]